jgi:hypothetical protein
MFYIVDTSFPTPMEEPKKVLRCHYVGSDLVGKPTGRSFFENFTPAIQPQCS